MKVIKNSAPCPNKKLAITFHLSSDIFNGVTDMRFDFRYSGDCLGMLTMLCTSNTLVINGKRNEKNILIKRQ